MAIVDRQFDSGRRIGIIRRNSVRSDDLTGHYHCEFQLKRCLKVERQFIVQVVLLMNTNLSTKIIGSAVRLNRGEDILKSCDGGITQSSPVFLRPKILKAENQPLL